MAGPPEVLIVARNPETRDGLEAYLTGAGLAAGSVADLSDVAVAAVSCKAVVLFPDDYGLREARATIDAIRSSAPEARVVVVTATARAFAERGPLCVLVKPAFGWTILDAIRPPGPGEPS
jgi:hypothetical protein